MLDYEQKQPKIQLIRYIGAGRFGHVFEAEDKKTKKRIALKRTQKVGNQLSRQYEILKKIKGKQNLVQMQYIFYTQNESKTKVTQNIAFQHIDSNLQNRIESAIQAKMPIQQHAIKRYMFQLLNGLKNLHQLNIAHRDLKPQNVLLSKNSIIKICDFGCSKIIDEDGKNTPFIVSKYYRAPELIFCMTKYTTAIDIWSAGCILAQLYLLQPYFEGKSIIDEIKCMVRRIGWMTKSDIAFYNKNCYYDMNLLKSFFFEEKEDLQIIFKMSKDRKNLIDLLLRLLQYNPTNRITAQQALSHMYFDQVRQQFYSN